jgi:hypothetical protein
MIQAWLAVKILSSSCCSISYQCWNMYYRQPQRILFYWKPIKFVMVDSNMYVNIQLYTNLPNSPTKYIHRNNFVNLPLQRNLISTSLNSITSLISIKSRKFFSTSVCLEKSPNRNTPASFLIHTHTHTHIQGCINLAWLNLVWWHLIFSAQLLQIFPLTYKNMC